MDWESTSVGGGEAFLILTNLPESVTSDDFHLLLEFYPIVSIDIRVMSRAVDSSEALECSAWVKMPSAILVEDAKRYLIGLQSNFTEILGSFIDARTQYADDPEEIKARLTDPAFAPLPSSSPRSISREAYYLFDLHLVNDADNRNVVIRNLPSECSEEDLLVLLKGYDPEYVWFDSGLDVPGSGSFAGVIMNTAKDAKLAEVCLTGTILRGHSLFVIQYVDLDEICFLDAFWLAHIESQLNSTLSINPSGCTLDELIEWAHAREEQRFAFPAPWPYPIIFKDKHQQFVENIGRRLAACEVSAARRASETTSFTDQELHEMNKLDISVQFPLPSSASEDAFNLETSSSGQTDPLEHLDNLSLRADEPLLEIQQVQRPTGNHPKASRRVKPVKHRHTERRFSRAPHRAKARVEKSKKNVRRRGQGHILGLERRSRLERSLSPSPSSHEPSSPHRQYRQREQHSSPIQERIQPRQEHPQGVYTVEAQWRRWDAAGDLNGDLQGRMAEEYNRYWARRDWTDHPSKDDWPCVARGWKV